MALGPRPMDQMNEEPQMPLEEGISYGEAYGATKSAVRQYHPELADQYEVGMQEVLAELGTLTAEELDAFRQLIEYIEKNKDRYQEVVAELVARDLIDEGDFPPEYDEEFMAVLRAAVEEAYQRGMAVEMPSPQGFAQGGLADAAEALRQQGRFGDTMLAHITPQEAGILKAMGGSGTINPATGLPEFFLGKVFKAIGRAVRGVVRGVKKVLSSPIGRIVGTIALTPFVGPVAAGAIVGGVTGGIKGAILGGIGGYVGSPGFTQSALGSTIGKGLVSTLGQTGAQFAINTATGTAMGLLGGAKLSDAVKGGVAGAAFQYAMNRPSATNAPIVDKSTMLGTQQVGTGATAIGPGTMPSPAMPSPLRVDAGDIFEYQPLQQQINRAAAIATGNAPQASPSSVLFQGSTAPVTPPPNFGFERLVKEPLSYASDVYSTYLSPSRQSAQGSGALVKYGPLAAAGIGTLALAGGFEQPPVRPPGIVPEETGEDLIARDPSRYLVGGLPGVRYDARGNIIGNEPYSIPVGSSFVPTEDVLSAGGIGSLSMPVYTPPPAALTTRPNQPIPQPYNTASIYEPYFPRGFAEGGVAAAPASNAFMDQASGFAPASFARGGQVSTPSYALTQAEVDQLRRGLGTTVASPSRAAINAASLYGGRSTGTASNPFLLSQRDLDALRVQKLVEGDIGRAYTPITNTNLPARQPAANQQYPLTEAQVAALRTKLAGGPEQLGFGEVAPTTAEGIFNRFRSRYVIPTSTTAATQLPSSDTFIVPAETPLTGNVVPTASLAAGGIAGISGPQMARGGYPRRTGQISGPGTETSDDIPAMLSDGEFVMTARAVRGMGRGSRRVGAKKMYQLMHQLEKRASPKGA